MDGGEARCVNPHPEQERAMTAAIRHRRMMKPVDETRGAPHACRVENETIMQTYEALHVDEPPRDANGDVIEAGGYHGFHSFWFFFIYRPFIWSNRVRSFGPIVRSFGPIVQFVLVQFVLVQFVLVQSSIQWSTHSRQPRADII